MWIALVGVVAAVGAVGAALVQWPGQGCTTWARPVELPVYLLLVGIVAMILVGWAWSLREERLALEAESGAASRE